MMLTSAGRIESTDVVREDSERYILLEGESIARPIRIEADRESLKKLIRVAERAMPEENAFRDDPPDEQLGLDDLSDPSDVTAIEMENGSTIEVGDDDGWLEALDADGANISVPDEEKPQPGDYINPNDPSEW